MTPEGRALTANAPTCASGSSFTGNKKCAEAIGGALGNLIGLVAKGFAGGWEDVEGTEIVGSVLDTVQGFIEAYGTLPLTMVSKLMFPLLKSFVGVAMENPTEDTVSGYISLKQIFKRKLRSNQLRMDALEGQFDWFEGLFLKNESLINSSTVYKSAALSFLLNMQHDFELDQELFFGAECLLTGRSDNFGIISAGKCSAALDKDNSILSWKLCEQAARALGLGDVTVENLTRADGSGKPHGCYFKYGEGEGLYFNSRSESSGQNATNERQALCSTSAVSGRVAAECHVWQQAGTWELAAMYAITNLGVLVDIVRNFPELRTTTLKRAQTLTSKYKKLLNASFSEYRKHRMSRLESPRLFRMGLWCAANPFWPGRYVTEGRDYFYQQAAATKCRGPCDVMSDYCSIRPEKGSGKYCVEDEEKWGEAEKCFQRYESNLAARLDTEFEHVMGNLTKLGNTVTALR